MKPDLALLPIARFVTFGVRDGVEAVRNAGAVLTAPIHYGQLLGTSKNGKKFVRIYPGESILLNNALKN